MKITYKGMPDGTDSFFLTFDLTTLLIGVAQRHQYSAAINIVQNIGTGALRVRHHAEHVATIIADACNVIDGAIRV